MALIGAAVRKILNQLRYKYLFDPNLREQICRQTFFHNAFKALTFNGIDGDYAEFGSHSGMTFGLAYHESRRHGHGAQLWSFDSFQGLPEADDGRDDHPAWQPSSLSMALEAFHDACARNGIPRDVYHVTPGFYADTLPSIKDGEEPANIALAYIDCDLYTSTKTVLEFLVPRLKHGMIVAFDDYFCWSAGQISGERKAMLELFAGNEDWNLLPYMTFGWHGNAFIVEKKTLLA